MISKNWTIGAAVLPLLGVAATFVAARADGSRTADLGGAPCGTVFSEIAIPASAPAAVPPAENASCRGGDELERPAAPRCRAGDWSRLAERIANDRAARFAALDLLASGRIPHGARRREMIGWLRASGDVEAIAALDGVLRDLEARRYAAATDDESALLEAIAFGSGAARMEAIETLRPELLACDAVRSALERMALGTDDPGLAKAAILALAKSPDEATTIFLAERLEAGAGAPADARAAAAAALAQRRSDVAARSLAASLGDPAESVVVKRFAAQGLSVQEPTDAVVRALEEAYHGELDFNVRFNAVAGLQAHAIRADVRDGLFEIFATDPSDDIRALAMAALAMAGHAPDIDKALEAGRRDSSPKVRQMAASLAALKP